MSGRYDWWLDDDPDPEVMSAVIAEMAAEGRNKFGDIRLIGTPKEVSPLWELWKKSMETPVGVENVTEQS